MVAVIPADILKQYEALHGTDYRLAVESLVARLLEAEAELTPLNLGIISEHRGIGTVFSHAGEHDRSACEWTIKLARRIAVDAVTTQGRVDTVAAMAVIEAADFGFVLEAIRGELPVISGHVVERVWPPRGIRGLVSELASWKAMRETSVGAAYVPNEGSAPVATEDVDAATRKLSGVQEAAYRSYERAERHHESSITDKDAYNWLKEHDPEEYELPPEFKTWQRYVRAGRKHYETQKNESRSGRTGLSLATGANVESAVRGE